MQELAQLGLTGTCPYRSSLCEGAHINVIKTTEQRPINVSDWLKVTAVRRVTPDAIKQVGLSTRVYLRVYGRQYSTLLQVIH